MTRTTPAASGGHVHGGILRVADTPDLLDITPTYADRFTLVTDVRADARRWAEATFEKGIDRASRMLIFHTVLGLEVGPDDRPDAVAGWRIHASHATHVLLGAVGPGSVGRLLIETSAGSVSLTTAFAFHSRRRRFVWAQVSRIHRRLAAPTLRTGARLLQASGAGGAREAV
ncbi:MULTISPECIES: hypothetical protein [Microbacterium]|uniref:DUF2867 domain-containing protein n=1 Tax=Microbacterium wangchenii TaxID=2541726 RepID=A0ABX5SS04_9MICO|nr:MULTISPECIES: hypothetical protein [Microbacterium]MCK6065509.1 hypothetical protein [Microbacterium sp. EYE_512]QBR88935.1 hypothetical protein E4K62_09695 [Microbacterium wangchenii]